MGLDLLLRDVISNRRRENPRHGKTRQKATKEKYHFYAKKTQ